MQRTILVAVVTALVAAGISAGATILLTDDDTLSIASALPTTSPLVVEDTEEPSALPTGTDDGVEPAPAPGTGGSEPDDGGDDDGDEGDGATIRSASSVDCEKEAKKCSPEHAVDVSDDEVEGSLHRDDPPSYSGVPTITMTTELRKNDDSEADDGDELGSIFVEVLVENKTDETFVFNKREVALDIYRDGKLVQTLVTEGAGFDLTPGGKMNATFDRPITSDGEYEWQAKIWYYTK